MFTASGLLKFHRTQAASFGGSNIDPTAWEDKKCPGESRFPAQVSVKIQNHPQQLNIARF
jgi:hypothetical protein